MIDSEAIKSRFPIFKRKHPSGVDLIYLDNAATTQKPQQVIDAISKFYSESNANIGRGNYSLGSEATENFEAVRNEVSQFIGSESYEQIVFTAGTTDGINKLMNAFLRPNLKRGDEVIISEMEHHANLIPWQQLCLEAGAKLMVIPILDSGDLDLSVFRSLLNKNTRFVALTAVSNSLGVVNDIETMIRLSHEIDVPILIDAAQKIAHEEINVKDLDCDFMVFSGHKMYGPTGIGVLYGKEEHLRKMNPLSYGGGMVKDVKLDETIFAGIPQKHEAGTPNIAGVVGLGAAVDFINSIGLDKISSFENDLKDYALTKLSEISNLIVLGNPHKRAPIISFTVNGIHPHDVSGLLNESGIAIRAGHHCTQPLIEKLAVSATSRISFAVYNTKHDVDQLVKAINETIDFFA